MNRPPRRLFALACLIAGAFALFACGHVCAAPQALAIQDFKNETGEDRFNSFEHFLPEALAECVWQLPGIARGPATDCEPTPHAKFWVYRMMGTEKDLRATPPPDDVRKYLDEFVASYLAQPNPLDYPAAPEMFLTGSIAKASGGLEVTIRLAAASGETVKEVRLTAPVEKAVITVPAEAAWELRRSLTSARAADEPRPALGTQSLKAAEAYLEALFFLRWATVDFLKKAAELSDASDPVESKDSSARLAEDAFKSLYVGREYAMSSLRLATALDPHFALPHAQLGVLYLQGAGLATEGMSREDAIAAGREEYEAAVRLGYISPGTLTGLAGALFMEAQLAISAGDTKKGNALWDRSIQAWLDAVRAEPDGASVRRSAANAYIQRALDQTDEAHPKIVDREAFEAGLTLLREAVKLAPECQEANERLRSVESLQAQ